ncbi:MAG: flagellar FliJ family protein [Planctomycetota bacterium]|nr:flagellar FliJ family protein [Planctomycetota bacterium]
MPRFVFTLDPLFRARQRVEETLQRQVAHIERERLELERKIRRQQEAISEGKRAMQDQLVGTLCMGDLRDQAGSTLRVMRDTQKVVLELAGIHKRLDATRQGLLEASKERRAIELLRERREEQWRKKLEKAENEAMDELAIFAAARKDSDS